MLEVEKKKTSGRKRPRPGDVDVVPASDAHDFNSTRNIERVQPDVTVVPTGSTFSGANKFEVRGEKSVVEPDEINTAVLSDERFSPVKKEANEEALAIKIKLPKFEEANEIHGTRSKPWSTPHAHKYEHFGVACTAGSKKIIHGLRKCIDDHWDDGDFVVLKADMRNAFNLVSRQAILDECASLFPELLPWVLWCYGTHSALWHPMGRVSSESGVQQGDPLGPLLFALVLQKIISVVDMDVECIQMLFNAWFLDDGVLAGTKSAVLRAMHLIEELGPTFGFFINRAKCELFSCNELSSTFPFIASRHKIASKLLSKLASIDPQVALILLRLCAGFCKMVHVARTTPPHLAFGSLESFDSDIRMCFSNCVVTDISDVAWKQAQLGLSYGGLGLRSISHHSCATYIASLSFSGLGSADNPHLRILFQRLDDHSFGLVIAAATDADKAHLLSTSAPHAASWLSVVPSVGLGLHLDPNELQIAVKWWLGLDTSRGSSCDLCPDVALDPLGHHAAQCKKLDIRYGHIVRGDRCLKDYWFRLSQARVDSAESAPTSPSLEVTLS
eukprot:Em0007g565a